MSNGFPTGGTELTHVLVVRDVQRAKSFYLDVLGAELYREYGGTSVVLRFLGNWLLLVTGGAPGVGEGCSSRAGGARSRTRRGGGISGSRRPAHRYERRAA